MQPTDLVVAGCGVCMIYRAQMLPPGMGVPSYCFFSNTGRPSGPGTYSQPVSDSFSFMTFIASVQLPSTTFVVPSVVPA